LEGFEVKKINYEDTKDWILNKHYAHRMPSISYSFGLFQKNVLVGVMTIGKPASNSLCIGVCGEEFKNKVYELNRLVVVDNLPKNALSYFVSKSLKQLKQEDLILVSYADESMNHHGYIYQATNWIYTGKTKSRTDKYTPKNKHSRHYNDDYNHLRKVRTSKHRYIYFTGKSKKEYLNKLRYKIENYPKGNNSNYELGFKLKTKIINTKTGQIYYE
jgi:hypothetical protein